ncbi:MAG: CDP-alcohol phosphatidyltransferase family protein [Chthoniobacterales bacterium]
MTAPSETRAPALESTYKARAVESLLDVYFYRKVGYQLALFFARLKMTPAQVTLAGGALGIAAGHLYYYRDLRLNLLGMGLHVLSNAFDNADGQLARLTNRGSRTGRALDGLVDNLVFASVYVHLCLRYIASGGSQLVWLLAIAAGASHSLQSSAADYYRNAWLHFAEEKKGAELDSSSGLESEYDQLSWREEPMKKFLSRLYLNYTRQQEWLAPRLHELRHKAVPPDDERIAQAYREASRRFLPWLNLLATNPRMILLFVLLFAGQSIWYFVLELTLFNLLLVVLLREENAVCRRLL